MKLTHLPASEYRMVPWKNGGGHTQEMAVWPPHASVENFHWRISMATVTQAGAFSLFPEIERHLTLLQGQLRLEVAGHWHRLNTGHTLQFAGDVPTFGAPIRGEVTDLNIMTRRGVCRADVHIIEAGQSFKVEAGEGFIFAFAPLQFYGHDLSTHDLLRFESRMSLPCGPLSADIQLIYLRSAYP